LEDESFNIEKIQDKKELIKRFEIIEKNYKKLLNERNELLENKKIQEIKKSQFLESIQSQLNNEANNLKLFQNNDDINIIDKELEIIEKIKELTLKKKNYLEDTEKKINELENKIKELENKIPLCAVCHENDNIDKYVWECGHFM
jgi:glutamine synthetase type III